MKLQRIQNRAARLILKPRCRPMDTRSVPLLQQLSWLPIKLRIMFKVCVILFKCVHNLAPSYLTDSIHIHARDARLRQPRDNELSVRRSSRKVGASSLFVTGPSWWNSLPPELRTTNELMPFRRKLKTYLWSL